MTAPTFVLIPGAGGDAWYWHRTSAELESRGYAAIAVDILEDDPALGLPEYADVVLAAIGSVRNIVLVGQSLGGFTVPMVARRLRPRCIVLVNAMIPLPGETPADWSGNTGSGAARAEADRLAGRSGDFDVGTYFFHDLPPQVRAEARGGGRQPADTPFGQPCDFDAWPDVPVHVVVGADDRLFPAPFQQRISRERLGVEADVIAGGHLVALANPVGLTDLLVGYLD